MRAGSSLHRLRVLAFQGCGTAPRIHVKARAACRSRAALWTHEGLVDTAEHSFSAEPSDCFFSRGACRCAGVPGRVLASQPARVEGSACRAVIQRLVRAAHPCSSACCQRGEGELRVSRATRHSPHGTHDRRCTTACLPLRVLIVGWVPVPVVGRSRLGSVSAVWVELLISTPMRRFCFSGKAVVMSLFPAHVRAFLFWAAW